MRFPVLDEAMISEASILLLIFDDEKCRIDRAIQRERMNIRNSQARIDDLLARKKILATKMLAISSAAKSECLIYERETNAFTC